MNVLFDNGVRNPIARSLNEHEVTYARRIGWQQLENGELIRQAKDAGYDVLLSTDKNIRYQQNLTGRRIALVVLSNSQWPIVRLDLEKIASAVKTSKPGSYTEILIPFE